MNRITAIITNTQSSGSVTMVDLAVGDCQLSALMVEASELPAWLCKGNTVSVVFKETEVSIAKDFTGKISMRNQIECIIKSIERGQLMSIITMESKHFDVQSAITTRSVDQLQLEVGDRVTALIKANELSLMNHAR